MSVQQTSHLIAIGRVTFVSGVPTYEAQRGVTGTGPTRYTGQPAGFFVIELDDTTGGLSKTDCSHHETPEWFSLTDDTPSVCGEIFTDTDGKKKIRVQTSLAVAPAYGPPVPTDVPFSFTVHRTN